MNKTYIRSRVREAGKEMRRILSRAKWAAREELEEQQPKLKALDRKISALETKLVPLRQRQHKLKSTIEKLIDQRFIRAQNRFDEIYENTMSGLQTAIKESELVDARDRALVFLREAEHFPEFCRQWLTGEREADRKAKMQKIIRDVRRENDRKEKARLARKFSVKAGK